MKEMPITPEELKEFRKLTPVSAIMDEAKKSGEIKCACKACGGSLFYDPSTDIYRCGVCGWQLSMLDLIKGKRTGATRAVVILKEEEIFRDVMDVYREEKILSPAVGSPESPLKYPGIHETCYYRRRFYIDGKEREVFLPDWLHDFIRRYEGMTPAESSVAEKEATRLAEENEKLRKRLKDANF